NSYNSLNNGDSGLATAQITGFSDSRNGLSSASDAADAFNSGKLVTLASNGDATKVAANIVNNHAYALLYADAGTDQFTLINPWGLNGGYEGSNFKPGIVTETWAQLQASFYLWSQAGANPTPQLEIVVAAVRATSIPTPAATVDRPVSGSGKIVEVPLER